jgi:hypothetical protein
MYFVEMNYRNRTAWQHLELCFRGEFQKSILPGTYFFNQEISHKVKQRKSNVKKGPLCELSNCSHVLSFNVVWILGIMYTYSLVVANY